MDVHLARYMLADLFLDTFNFNAHTTANEDWGGLLSLQNRVKSLRQVRQSSNATGLKELVLKLRVNMKK